MTQGLEIIPCSTANELFEKIRPGLKTVRKWPRETIYRGHGNAGWKLIPRALRESDGKHADWLVFEEWALLKSFVEACDRTGVKIPGDGNEFRASLDQNSGALNEGVMRPDSWPAEKHWEVWAMAQHYGLPTRFLDWSRSSLVAMYFAAEAALLRERDAPELAVWALPPDGEPSWPGKLVVRAIPASHSPNLAAQSGLFTETLYRTERGQPLRVTAVEDIIGGTWRSGGAHLLKYVLPRREAANLLELCEAFGVCGATMFPGPGGAVRSALEQQARYADEEARRG